jgi:hypothetical protein
MNPKTPSEKSPQLIGEILDRVLPPTHGGITENRKVASRSNKPRAGHQISVENRIVKLEQKIKLLDHQVKKIVRTLDVRPASK